MKYVEVELALEKKGVVDHIDVTLGGLLVPFQNGAQPKVKMEILIDRPHMLNAEINGQPGGSIQVSVKPGKPKIPISHLKSRIIDGETSDISYGEFSVAENSENQGAN